MPSASSSTANRAPAAHVGNRFCAVILAALSTLFALRALGQAVQRWVPQPFLPPFDAFQGSDLPYWLLLSSQLVILGLMIGVTSRVWWGVLKKSPRSARILGRAGGLYMAGSLARLAVGVAMPDAPAWFTAWIPALFHVVLAGFVLTLAAYHAPGRTQGEDAS